MEEFTPLVCVVCVVAFLVDIDAVCGGRTGGWSVDKLEDLESVLKKRGSTSGRRVTIPVPEVKPDY
jgi:hypothetical protein